MELLTDERKILSAQAADIEFVFGRTEATGLFVLSRSPADFIQAIRFKKTERYLLRYVEAGVVHRAKDRPDLLSVRRDFLAYFASDISWHSAHRWKRLNHGWI